MDLRAAQPAVEHNAVEDGLQRREVELAVEGGCQRLPTDRQPQGRLEVLDPVVRGLGVAAGEARVVDLHLDRAAVARGADVVAGADGVFLERNHDRGTRCGNARCRDRERGQPEYEQSDDLPHVLTSVSLNALDTRRAVTAPKGGNPLNLDRWR